MLIKHTAVIVMATCILGACSRSQGNHPRDLSDSTGHFAGIQLTPQEISKAGIQFGALETALVDKWVACEGSLVLSQQKPVKVTMPFSGTIRSIDCSSGDYIKFGATLARIENLESLKLQQEYLEAVNQLEYTHEEYKRQGELTVENATSVKKMQIARRDYQTAELKVNALRLQLKTFGINADSLHPDNLIPLIDVIAPCSGYVQHIGAHPHTFVSAGEEVLTMADPQQLMVRLEVPEGFVTQLMPGQFEFCLKQDTLAKYKAVYKSLPQHVDPQKHMAILFATIPKPNPLLLPGMSVVATLKTRAASVLVQASSIQRDAAACFIFVLEDGTFSKIPVTVGKNVGELTEITSLPPDAGMDSVVTRGGDFLNGILEKK